MWEIVFAKPKGCRILSQPSFSQAIKAPKASSQNPLILCLRIYTGALLWCAGGCYSAFVHLRGRAGAVLAEGRLSCHLGAPTLLPACWTDSQSWLLIFCFLIKSSCSWKDLISILWFLSQRAALSPSPPISSCLWAEGKTLGMHLPKTTKKVKSQENTFFECAWLHEVECGHGCCEKSETDLCSHWMILKTDCTGPEANFQRWNSSFPKSLFWLILGSEWLSVCPGERLPKCW